VLRRVKDAFGMPTFVCLVSGRESLPAVWPVIPAQAGIQ
jgi:hypothetical protein